MKRIVILVCVAILAMQTFSDYTLSAQIITSANIIRIKDNSKQEAKEQKKEDKKREKQAKKDAQEQKKLDKKREQQAKKDAQEQKKREKSQKTEIKQNTKIANTQQEVLKKEDTAKQKQTANPLSTINKKANIPQKPIAQIDIPTQKFKYGQFVDVSYSRSYSNYITGPNYITKSIEYAINTVSINYIGGCLIKERFFLGLGTGADVYLHQEVPQKLSKYSFYNSSLINIPVFLHFRAEFMKTKCSPYIALSGGCSFTTEEAASQIHRQNRDYTYYYRLFGDATLGVNLRISKKMALYLGAGYKIEAIPSLGLWHGFSTRFGVKF